MHMYYAVQRWCTVRYVTTRVQVLTHTRGSFPIPVVRSRVPLDQDRSRTVGLEWESQSLRLTGCSSLSLTLTANPDPQRAG